MGRTGRIVLCGPERVVEPMSPAFKKAGILRPEIKDTRGESAVSINRFARLMNEMNGGDLRCMLLFRYEFESPLDGHFDIRSLPDALIPGANGDKTMLMPCLQEAAFGSVKREPFSCPVERVFSASLTDSETVSEAYLHTLSDWYSGDGLPGKIKATARKLVELLNQYVADFGAGDLARRIRGMLEKELDGAVPKKYFDAINAQIRQKARVLENAILIDVPDEAVFREFSKVGDFLLRKGAGRIPTYQITISGDLDTHEFHLSLADWIAQWAKKY